MNWIIAISLIAFAIICYLYILEKNKNIEIKQRNEQIDKENEELVNRNKTLKEVRTFLTNEIYEKQDMLKQSKEISNQAFESYCEVLDADYQKKEQEYTESAALLAQSYETKQAELLNQIDTYQKDLDKIRATQAAAIQARIREQEIEKNISFYTLELTEVDKKEVHILQSVEPELRDPRPIRMAIWNAYYIKKANELYSRVVGNTDICGIYKITNMQNGMCYIGQARNIKERWREHMKCGLGIDTPANNQLYKDMKKQGLSDFTFELLEQCPITELNEKEAFYINAYDSKNYGYNSTSGNKTF